MSVAVAAPVKSFTFDVWCPAHPEAGVELLARDDEGLAVSRAHVRCVECGLPWTITATLVPTKAHIAEGFGVDVKHPKGGVAA